MTLYTLEPPWLENQTDRSCIPEGSYKCVLAYSNRFKRLTPHVLDVPGRCAIEIHAGNVLSDTCGCILVGKLAVGDSIFNSQHALEILCDRLSTVSRSAIPVLTIRSEPPKWSAI